MTPIGHTLTGLAIGYLTIPADMTVKQKGALFAAFAVVASLPDFPLGRYIATHSIFVVTASVAALVLFAKIFLRRSPYFTNRFLVGWGLAWYSHLLLDTMYNRPGPQGYEILWPFSYRRIGLPVPWLLQADKVNVLSWHNVSVAFFEILTFGAVLVLAILIKKCFVPVPELAETSAAE